LLRYIWRGPLAECGQCRARYAVVESLWTLTGRWEVPAMASSIANRVLAQVAENSQDRHGRRSPWPALRVAALLAIAIGGGHLAGRQFWPAPMPSVASQVTEERAAESLAVDELGGSAAIGWVEAIAGDEDVETEETNG